MHRLGKCRRCGEIILSKKLHSCEETKNMTESEKEGIVFLNTVHLVLGILLGISISWAWPIFKLLFEDCCG